jgi:hypothetical protein
MNRIRRDADSGRRRDAARKHFVAPPRLRVAIFLRPPFILYLIILVAAPMLPAYCQEALAQGKGDEGSLSALLQESIRKSNQNWETMSRHYYNYTFKWRRAVRKMEREGKLLEESELYEVFIPTARCWTKDCRRAVVLLEENGKPLPAERIERERLKVGRKLEKAERDEGKQSGASALAPVNPNWMRFYVHFKEFAGKGAHVVLDGQEILEKCDFSRARRERIAGREMIALDFRPRAGAAFAETTAYMTRAEGRIWIDAEDKVFTRLAVWPQGAKLDETVNSDEVLKRAALGYDLVRTKEGVWFFSFGRINGAQFPDLFPKLKRNFSIEQFNYINFRVEVENSKVVAPEN